MGATQERIRLHRHHRYSVRACLTAQRYSLTLQSSWVENIWPHVVECDSGWNPDPVPKSYPSVGLMRVDGGARLGLGITQRDWPRSGILADVMGVGVDHRVAPGGWFSGVCRRLASPTAGLPDDVQPNLRNCNDCRSEQRQEDFLDFERQNTSFAHPQKSAYGNPPIRRASPCVVRPTMSRRQYKSH
jgi:hypothetical protein